MAQGEWKIYEAIMEYFHTRRTVARAMQRMMVACAVARKKAITEARDNEIVARLGGCTRGEEDEVQPLGCGECQLVAHGP